MSGNMTVTLESDKKQRRNKQKNAPANTNTNSNAMLDEKQLEMYARVLDEGDRSALHATMREVVWSKGCIFENG